MVLNIATIKIWDDTPIDTSSEDIKNKVAQSISAYILNHWDECVKIISSEQEEKYETEFSVIL